MRKARRWWLLLASITLTLLALAPVAIGRLISNQLPQAISQIDQQVGHYEVSLTSLVRGWLSTTGTLAVSRADGRAVLSYPFKLRHGLVTPKPGWIRGSGELLSPDSEAMGELAFNLSITGQMNVNLALTEASGFEGKLGYQQSLRNQRWSLTSHGLSGSSFKDVRGQLENLADGIYQLDLTAAQLTGPNWSVQEIQTDATLTSVQPFADLALDISAQYWSRPGMARFTGASAKTTLKHLSLPVLAQALELRDTASALALLPSLLERQPVIESLSMNLDHPLGTAQADLSAHLTQKPPAGFAVDLSRALPVLALQAQWDLSEALALAWTRADYLAAGATRARAGQYAQSQWERNRQSGWVQRNGTRLTGQTELERGLLTVNGVQKGRW
ncbi:MAG: DUF945 family protein [Lysobacterales bacterium]